MGWNISAIDAPASQVKINFDEIPDDVREGVEEMFTGLSGTQRGIVVFENEADRDVARAQIRAYCEARKAGRLTASIWAGYTNAEQDSLRSGNKTETYSLPALSLAFTVYVKKERGSAENGQPSAS